MLCFACAATLLLLQGPDPAEVSADRIRETLGELCRLPRLAGSPGGQAGADYAAAVFAEAGLRVERARYRIHAPRQTGQRLAILGNGGSLTELDLHERGFAEDPRTLEEPVPPMHGLAATGHAGGPVVYAGFGLPGDFEALRQAGVELEGSIALIRYGRLYRGLKVANAEQAGCAGALLYSDRRDDGADRGAPLPEGPWRPADGIQRGSVYNADGDPTTPGWPSLPGAERLPLAEAVGLVGIPSLPISQANASLLLGEAGLPDSPCALAATVEMEVEQDPALVEIENVLGWIEGSTHPDEWVIAGAHRDAWGYGAVDNGSGSAVLLEAARVLGAALKRGWKPERSLILATWDAEEWGLVGSTEWVEQYREQLAARGIAYLNLDVVASGPSFGASCSPGMAELLRQCCADSQVEPPASLGVPGGGSDHVPFLELAGMEVAAFGFHGGHGSYHSSYDTPFLVERHLDPGFAHHAAAARLLLRLLGRLSDAEQRLDGLDGWARQTLAAAAELPLPEAQRQRLIGAAQELVDAAQERIDAAQEGGASLPHAERFLRFFLPAERGRRLLLWRSEGYGASWFPEVRAVAADAEADPGTEAAIAALHRAARSFRQDSPRQGSPRERRTPAGR